MKNLSNNSELELIRLQMNCVKGSANELIEKGTSESSADELPELIAWLQESPENRKRFDQLQQLDGLIRESIVSSIVSLGIAGSEFSETDAAQPISVEANPQQTKALVADDFAERMKKQLASITDAEPTAEVADSEEPDYQSLFEQSDLQEQLLLEAPADSTHQPKVGVKDKAFVSGIDSGDGVGDRESTGRRTSTKWWIATAASVMGIALSITIAMMWNPPVENSAPIYTAEMLCDQSLDWNPNGPSEFAWNQDLESAPADRLFPAHLIRHQAQSWRRIQIEGDEQAVVYNLVPEGHLSELKAYLYVFKTGKDYQLPSQFGSHPNANRKYKFWSLACQQDLVFVLVYEGDEKRLHELVKRQDVG